MTAHWFSDESDGRLNRKSAAIVCVRFFGKHSYDHIPAVISQTRAAFDIEGKITLTCTDNGSNMVKAFTESKKAKERYRLEDEKAADEEPDTMMKMAILIYLTAQVLY